MAQNGCLELQKRLEGESRRNPEERNRKYFELNENKNTRHQNLWDTAKANLGEKFIAVNTYVRKEEKSQISNQSLYLKKLLV